MGTKNCQNCKQSFTIEPDDFGFYEKMRVPPPSLCPECRFRRRSVFRNERTLYNQTCKLCSRSVVTMYHPKSPYVVYCNDCWFSDKWDSFSYAQPYQPQKSFFEQLGELLKRVPKAATYSSPHTGPNINSEYCNFAGGNKNCYLVFNSGPGNEDCAYSRGIGNGKDVFDSYFGDEIERVYEGVNVQKSSCIAWAQNASDCLDSSFLLNCAGCQSCFGCVNLRHKSYCFLNEPLPKNDWKRKVLDISGSYKKTGGFRKQFENFSLKFPRREHNNLKSVNCTGNYIFESKDCSNCFEASFSEDTRYSFSVKLSKDCGDLLGHGRKGELLLEGVGVGVSTRVLGSWWVENSHDVEYSFGVRSSEYCFGCDGAKGARYAILNKQYGEKEYTELRSRIVQELKEKDSYGIFLPPELAFFAYNEGVGQDNMPLTKEEALAQGFRWEEDVQITRGKETLKPERIPDHIKDAPDSILNEVLACIECGRNYRLIKPELDFYRKMLIPIPRKCFNCRHVDRIQRRGPMKLFDRTCDKCKKPIKTNFAPDRPEIVYCESCYQKEVA